MYKVEISKLAAKHVKPLEDAFNDRDVQIMSYKPNQEEYDLYEVEIRNIHPVTMTPLMWWILHHIDKSDYYNIIIS